MHWLIQELPLCDTIDDKVATATKINLLSKYNFNWFYTVLMYLIPYHIDNRVWLSVTVLEL